MPQTLPLKKKPNSTVSKGSSAPAGWDCKTVVWFPQHVFILLLQSRTHPSIGDIAANESLGSMVLLKEMLLEDTAAVTNDESFPRSRKEVRKIRKLNDETTPQGWNLLVFVPALMGLYALFSLLLDLGSVWVHMLSRRCDHELKRRLMSQDMEAQTPICSQSHSGGCLSTKPHSVTEQTHTEAQRHTHTHICIHWWCTAGRPRTHYSVERSKKCVKTEKENRERKLTQREARVSLWLDVCWCKTLHPVGYQPHPDTSPWPQDLPSVWKTEKQKLNLEHWYRDWTKRRKRRKGMSRKMRVKYWRKVEQMNWVKLSGGGKMSWRKRLETEKGETPWGGMLHSCGVGIIGKMGFQRAY